MDDLERTTLSNKEDRRNKVCTICKKEYPFSASFCTEDNSELVQLIADPLVGTIFEDKYQILSVLGQGGMSIVYKARHKYMDRIVAVKLLHEHLGSDKLAVQRFQQESKAASALSHQNIVTVHDFGMTKSDQAFFVMDCLEGETLADILEREVRLSLDKAIEIFRQTCDGLAHAHKHGIVHRDLKPSNLVLVKQDDSSILVKIVDFGIAKLQPKDGKSKQQLTQTGEIFGSPLYMSPEQCNGKNLDSRSDIYSLGCLMYEALAGAPPFIGDNFINTVVKHLNEPVPAFSDTVPEAQIPPPIEACIKKCLAKSPDDRYHSASELRQSLLDAALESGLSGFRPGAVPERTSKAFLASTFDRVKLSSNNLDLHVRSKNKVKLYLTILIPLAILISLVLTIFLWPGPEGDRGPVYLKILWQYQMATAQDAITKQDYDNARKTLLEAKENALKFSDKKKHLLDTLDLLADVYGKSGMYAEQEKVNKEYEEINTSLVLKELSGIESLLAQLQKSSDSTVTATMNQLEAEANADKVLLCARKLFARNMYSDEERLLTHAISTFDHLKLANHQKSAELKFLLADCLKNQQRLNEVRPLLIQALTIRKELDPSSSQNAAKNLTNAYLKLGVFDRDQSVYKESEIELKEALNLAKKYLAKDHALLAECLNAYADLLRQTGKTSESKIYLEEAQSVSKNLEQHAKELIK